MSLEKFYNLLIKIYIFQVFSNVIVRTTVPDLRRPTAPVKERWFFRRNNHRPREVSCDSTIVLKHSQLGLSRTSVQSTSIHDIVLHASV
jgi:hypothetical protein